MIRLLHVLTVPASLRFLRGQPRFLRREGYEVHVTTSPGPGLSVFAEQERAEGHAIAMSRRITPAADLRSLARLIALMRRLRPSIVHAHTPKGGLLGVLAARAAGVPAVIYQMRGLPFVARRGKTRALLKGTERLSSLLADRVVCIGPSLREVALAEGLVSAEKSLVLAGGGNGIDVENVFSPNLLRDRGRLLRAELGIPSSAPVIGFVGRLVRDKGIVELAEAWRGLRVRFEGAHMLLVGPFEEEDPVPAEVRASLRSDPRVHLFGETEEVAPCYAAMDLLALPTYREGFPNVPMEAAAMELPVVATRIPGCTDAVLEGRTGLLVPPREARPLEEALAAYLGDPERGRAHGLAGRERVCAEFTKGRVFEAQLALYAELLRARGRS